MNDNEGEFFYDLNDASEIVWKNIPQHLRDKYAFGEIYFILEIEFHYLDSLGIFLNEDKEPPIHDYPIEIDWPKLLKYIVEKAIMNSIDLNEEELGDILDAELIYYDMNGALGDAREFLN
jgi:hypothetical protein